MPAKDPAFASRLRQLMEARQWTQSNAAAACGVTVTSLQNYLGGRLPQPAQAMAIAAAFETSLSWLLGEGDQQSLVEAQAKSQPLPKIKLSAFALMGRTPDDLAEDLGATPREVKDWMAGKAQPSHQQIILLFNELSKTASALAARCDCEGKSPELVSPHDARIQA